MTDLLLGIDVGTSACKAVVVDRAGLERAHGQSATPWRRVPTGAEVDPDALFDAAVAAARAALAGAAEGRVCAVGVTSMAEGGVLLDGHGRLLAPVIAWHDARGDEEASQLADDLGTDRFAESTGLPASPLCSLAKLRWLAEHKPATRSAARWLNVAEWVVRRLGGRDVAELSLASRTGLLDLSARAPFTEALAWAGLPRRPPARARDRRHARGHRQTPRSCRSARGQCSPSPATTTSSPGSAWAWWHRATCSIPAAPPRRWCGSSPRR